MAPRLSRSSVPNTSTSKSSSKPKPSRKRTLDAYATASHTLPPTSRKHTVSRHRLGETEPDNSSKRKAESDDEDEDDDEASQKRKKPRRGVEDEGPEEGSDSEGNEWTLGGLRNGSESESDLDSDEAFGESDEEKFEGFTFRGSSSAQDGKKGKAGKSKAKMAQGQGKVEMTLDESEEEDVRNEDHDEFGDEGVDLATMLDDDPDDDVDEAEGSDDDDDGEDSDDDNSQPSSSSSDGDESEDDDPTRLARLRDRVEALDPAPAAKDSSSAIPNAPISIDDLLADLDPAARAQYTAPLKLSSKKKSAATKTLTAPLPVRQQARIDRAAATIKAKEQLDRWRDTVIRNRRAEFLSFPLTDPDRTAPIGRETFTSLAEEKPREGLEERVREIMVESGLVTASKGSGDVEADGEEDVMKAEGLQMNAMPLEEVLKRRQMLRQQRDLLFREEIKAKRIAKIKSKSYRRTHRRERLKLEQAAAEAGLGAEDDREVQDRRRADARMSTKHRDSKFAKSLKATGRAVWDESARDGVNEQARRQEELRRRIAGEDVGDEDASGSGSEVDDDEGDDEAFVLRDDVEGAKGAEKGVGSMKFMRAAEERAKGRNREAVAGLRREMAVADGEEEDEGEVDEGLGRAIFGPRSKEGVPQVKEKRPEMEEGSEDDEKSGADFTGFESEVKKGGGKETQPKSILKKASGPLAASQATVRDRRDETEGAEIEASNSWLTGPKKASKGKRREDDDAVALNTLLPGPKVVSKKGPAVATKDEPSTSTAEANATEGWPRNAHPTEEEEADAASSPEPEDPLLTAAQQKSALYARAFAGDDVTATFATEKSTDAADEDSVETSTHLPGWGSWTGASLPKSIRKANARAAHNPLYKTRSIGVAAADRKDAGRKDVIISEKAERKGKKYLAPVLPRGFEGKEMYERSLRVPVGPEWTTKEVFQRNTRPRVVVKAGVVVGAMERPLV